MIASNVDTIVSSFSFLDLKQYFVINRKKVDLAFSNLVESQVKCKIFIDSLSKIKFHHDPVNFNIKLIDHCKYLPLENEKKNFYNADYEKICDKLKDINWYKNF